MWRTTINNLLSHKRRLLATSMAVVLSVAFLSAALTTGDTMTAGFDRIFTISNQGTDVVVRGGGSIASDNVSMRSDVPAALLQTLESIDGVDDVVAVREGSGRIVNADGNARGGDGPPTYAQNWLGDSPTNPWTIAEGRAPRDTPAGLPYEVVIDRASAAAGGLAVGDQTSIQMPDAVAVTIVGLVTIDGSDSLGPTTFTAFSDGASLALFDDPDTVSSFRVAAADGVSESELADAITLALPSDVEVLTGTETTAAAVAEIETDFLGAFKLLLLIFAAIALVVAGFSIHNTFSILIAQRTRESALLRAIGATRRQVLASVVAEAVVIGLVASAVGLLVGYCLASGFKALMDSLEFDLGNDGVVLTSATMLTSTLVGLLSTLAASLAPAIHAARVSPLAALRSAATDDSGTSKLRLGLGVVTITAALYVIITATSAAEPMQRTGLGALALIIGTVILGPAVARPAAGLIGLIPAAISGHSGRLARGNAMRDPRRTAGSASALLVGTAVVAVFTTFGSSVKASFDQTINESFGSDLVVDRGSFDGSGIDSQVAHDLAGLPEVDRAVGLSYWAAEFDGEVVEHVVADPPSLGAILDVDVSSGSLDAVIPGTIAVSDRYAEANGLTLGDEVEASFVDGSAKRFEIAATFGLTIVLNDVLMTPQDWAAHSDETSNDYIYVELRDGIDITDGAAAVDAVAVPNGAAPALTRDGYIDSLGSEIDQMLYFIYGMLAIAILIAVLGIANALALSIHERTRELGLLRAVGQTRAQVRRTVRWESVIVSLMGASGGVALGVFLGWALMRDLALEEGFGIFEPPILALSIVMALAALAGVLAAWRPAKRASQLDVLVAISAQ